MAYVSDICGIRNCLLQCKDMNKFWNDKNDDWVLCVNHIERDVLFLVHDGFGFRGLVALSGEVQNAVDDDAVQFVGKRFAELLCIGADCVKADDDVSVEQRQCAAVKSDDVGVVVVPEKLPVNGEDVLIVAKQVVDIACPAAVRRRNAAYP